MRSNILLGLALAGLAVPLFLGTSAAAQLKPQQGWEASGLKVKKGYEIERIETPKRAEAVRSCLATSLAGRGRPVETPNTKDGEATSWMISFLNGPDREQVYLERTETHGTRILYNRKIGIEPNSVYSKVRVCA